MASASATTREGSSGCGREVMCCGARVRPLDPATVRHVLMIGQFESLASGGYRRELKEEGTAVIARMDTEALVLSLTPAINVLLDHGPRRLAAAVMFEIAWRYAEKVNGEAWQLATVAQCRSVGVESSRYLARFPIEPFTWDKVCPGFQAVFGAGL